MIKLIWRIDEVSICRPQRSEREKCSVSCDSAIPFLIVYISFNLIFNFKRLKSVTGLNYISRHCFLAMFYKDLFKVTKTRCLTDNIKCRRMRWLGHVFRMERDRTAKIAPRRTPPGKRKPGRPRTTWCPTITKELTENHLTLGEALNKARDRLWWKQFVAALCPTGDEEE